MRTVYMGAPTWPPSPPRTGHVNRGAPRLCRGVTSVGGLGAMSGPPCECYDAERGDADALCATVHGTAESGEPRPRPPGSPTDRAADEPGGRACGTRGRPRRLTHR